MASEGCPAAYTVTQDGCARVERLCAAHVQRLIAGGASVEPADLSQAGLCDRCAAEEHSALEARRADIARQERKRTEAEVCSLLLLLREAFDTPWAGSDPAHVAEVAALKRRIQEALGGRYSGEDMLAVLEFYANAQNWETVYAGSAADGTQGPDFTPIDLDRGRRARQVLDLLETEEARVTTLGGSAVPGR